MKKRAFTLAETLIVIGIIGVVAALTLPNLNHATGDKETVTRVKKIYSALTDAVDRAQVIYGPCDEWIVGIEDETDTVNERTASRIIEFLKISKICGFDTGCFSSAPFHFFDGGIDNANYDNWINGSGYYSVILSDGTSLAFYNNNAHIRIKLDIDGPNKGPTREGYDLFDFNIWLYNTDTGENANQIYPSMYNSIHTGKLNETGSYYPNYLTAWIIQHGNLDYKKCPDELNWETQTSCK